MPGPTARTDGPDAQLPTPLLQVTALVAFVAVCFAAAAAGSLVTTPQIPNWYADLAKPHWTPPDWIFGPVWTLLYLMMATSAWNVWRQAEPAAVKRPLLLFGLQLALNSIWSALFFGFQNPGAAAAEIVLLWVSILATMILFWRCSRISGVLFVPYFAWVSFAAVLNVTIWQMNR